MFLFAFSDDDVSYRLRYLDRSTSLKLHSVRNATIPTTTSRQLPVFYEVCLFLYSGAHAALAYLHWVWETSRPSRRGPRLGRGVEI